MTYLILIAEAIGVNLEGFYPMKNLIQEYYLYVL